MSVTSPPFVISDAVASSIIRIAEKRSIEPDALVEDILAKAIEADRDLDLMRERAARGDPAKALAILDRLRDTGDPVPDWDRWPDDVR